MAASFNRVILAGNLTRDPGMKFAQSGTAIASLSLAVNNRVKKGEQWVDEPCFVDVTFFGRTAEVCGEYTTKGSNVLVEGRLKQESWEKDGQKRSKIVVIGDVLQLLGGRGEKSEGAPAAKRETPAPTQVPTPSRAATVPAGEDIPF